MEKICFKCGNSKSLDDYYLHPQMKDGHLNKCKECTKADSINTRNANLAYYQQYDRDRFHELERRADSYNRNRQFRIDNPTKYKAHTAVNNAVRDGRLVKEPCIICGSEKSQAHHEDYTKPLEVIWFCKQHHEDHHHKGLS